VKKTILKILKWIAILIVTLIIVIAGVVYLNTHKNPDGYFGIKKEARNILFGTSGDTKKADKELTKVQKMENSWREFDFSDIEGETPRMVFGTKPALSLGKYQIQDIKIYKDIGFIVGDNRKEVVDMAIQKPVHPDKVDELMQAYVFRTKDNGKTFDRECLGHGSAVRVKRINDDFYLTVSHFLKRKATLYKSTDMGGTWKEVEYIPWAVFNEKMMLRGIDENEEITYDGGETWETASKNLKAYHAKFSKSPYSIPYENKLVALKDRSLVFFNLETDEEEIVPLDIPKGKIISGHLHSDEETGELSIPLFPDIVGNPREEQGSIWFPLEDKEVVFDKKLPETVFLEVHGKHIGGFTKVEGVLTHIWTLDKGETWNYELLPHYFYNTKRGYGNGQIWMTPYVKGKEGVKKGSHLAIGTIKGYKKENEQ